MRRVAIVGIGNMGGAIAQRILDQRWPVQVFDIDASRVAALQKLGAVGRADAAQAAIDAGQTEDVLFGPNGAAQVMRAGQAVLLCPTIGPQHVEDFARRLAEKGIQAIDAPMSGGPAKARDGTMSLMVACDDDAFERQRAVIELMSNKVFRIGKRPGDGARAKLVNNLLAGINLAGAAEALALAQRLGLDLPKMLDVIENSSGQSWIGSDRMRRAMAGDFAPRAHVSLLQKDTRLAVEVASAAGFAGTLGPVACEVFDKAAQAGLGELDDAALFKLMSQA